MTHRAVRHEYAQLAQRYDLRWQRYLTATTAATLAQLPVPAAGSMLDIACGTGMLLHALQTSQPALTLAGVDMSPEMLMEAQNRLGNSALLAQATAEKLPFPDAAFDLATCVSALHHFPKPEITVAEIYRVLKPGSRFVLTDWCADYLSTRFMGTALRFLRRPIARIFGSQDCRQLLTATGFQVTGLRRYRIGIPWGMMTIAVVKPQDR